MAQLTLKERITGKTDRVSDCWLWRGRMTLSGYGNISVNNKTKLAHRVSYETFVGEIPIDHQIDHLCRNKMCVNPDHLEAVTNSENQRRTHTDFCVRGHELKGENLYLRKNRYGRTCRECSKIRQKKFNDKRKGA